MDAKCLSNGHVIKRGRERKGPIMKGKVRQLPLPALRESEQDSGSSPSAKSCTVLSMVVGRERQLNL